jgi:hypothetical protein
MKMVKIITDVVTNVLPPQRTLNTFETSSFMKLNEINYGGLLHISGYFIWGNTMQKKENVEVNARLARF